MADCPKLAKRRKLEEDPNAEKSQNCDAPGHEETNFRANIENRPPNWNVTEAPKTVIEAFKQARKQKIYDENNNLLRRIQTKNATPYSTERPNNKYKTTKRLAAST